MAHCDFYFLRYTNTLTYLLTYLLKMWPGSRLTSVPSSILIHPAAFGHNRHGPKIGGCCAPFSGWRSLVPKMWTGPRPTYEVASMQSFGHYRHGPRLIRTKATTASINFESGAAVPLSMGSWYPCNTMWPEPRPTSIPSGILIHPSIQPFGHNTSTLQTDRQRRTAIA